MGLAKRYMEEVEAQGWAPIDDAWVCERCVDEPFLANKIKEAAQSEEVCSFCEESPAAELNILLDVFMRGVKMYYEDAAGELFYDTEEGHYVGRAFHTWDLVTEEYGHIFTGAGLLEAVRDSIVDITWSDSHYWHYSPSEALTDGWSRFREAVMHESRYVFWLRRDWQDQDYGADGVQPAKIMEALSQYIDEHDLYHTIEIGDTFWRARTYTSVGVSWGAKDLGTAGREHAKQANRMSPAGIPMFYGAEDQDTAVRESLVRTSDTHVCIAAFQATRSVSVIDLTGSKLPAVPSEFDVEKFAERHRILFLQEFIKDLTRPIRESYEQIDYVPTQILMEYLLKVHQPEGGGSVAGLMYTSAVTRKTCVVLDVPNKRCIDRDDQIGRFDGHRLHLKMDAESMATFKIKHEYEPLSTANTDPFA